MRFLHVHGWDGNANAAPHAVSVHDSQRMIGLGFDTIVVFHGKAVMP